MNDKLLWSSLIFAIVGWAMYGMDKWINASSTDATTIGIVTGILGIFGILMSFAD